MEHRKEISREEMPNCKIPFVHLGKIDGYTCDWCGKECEELTNKINNDYENGHPFLVGHFSFANISHGCGYVKKFDLCRDCSLKLEEFALSGGIKVNTDWF